MLEDVGCLQKLSDQVISIDFLHHSVIWTNFCDLNILGITGSLKNNGSRKNLLRASISRGLGWWFQWRNWKRSNLPTVSVRRSRFYPLALILDDPGVLIHDSKISKPSNPHDSKWFPKIGLPKSSTNHPIFIHNSSTIHPQLHGGIPHDSSSPSDAATSQCDDHRKRALNGSDRHLWSFFRFCHFPEAFGRKKQIYLAS
jgi:hypothetical protein